MVQTERSSREDARAPLSDEQMRPAPPRYPVDRYLVESGKKIEMVNIIDDEIWDSEPALRPDEEVMLKKLHDMLQSTAEDLKLLTGELASYHDPAVQVKSQPTPLDEEFNEKVHIEEVVNAKFYGRKIVENSLPFSSESKQKNELHKAKVVNAGIQVNTVSAMKKPSNKNLQISRTKVVQIKESKSNSKVDLLNNGKLRKDTPKVHYNEISYEYKEPEPQLQFKKQLQVQKMPGVNIRSELKKQKVLQLDILPDTKSETAKTESITNVGVIAVQHQSAIVTKQAPSNILSQYPKITQETCKRPLRVTTKMSTCDSSESTCNNVSSDSQHKLDMQQQLKIVLRNSPKSSARVNGKNMKTHDKSKKSQEKRPHSSLDEWKKKLNTVYGQPSSSRRITSTKSKKVSPKKSNLLPRSRPKTNLLNNAEYIPYSQLTLGGVRVSDIEKEMSEMPNRKDVPLSPILDKILSSRENSFNKDSPKQHKESPRVLTTSDENLLQEVIDIEKTVSKTLAKSVKKPKELPQNQTEYDNPENNSSDNSYADDFEEEKSDQSEPSNNKKFPNRSDQSSNNVSSTANNSEEERESDENKSNHNISEPNNPNKTYTKGLNLSFKNSVDIFEFVHSVDTQDTATQSNSTSKISLKETQTSPRNESSNINPIRNDLWPSFHPHKEVENLFQLEKEFIKKLILEEYGEILEKNITKPSTSNEKDREDRKNNVAAFQKNTQTSPAHVKSVMTSPTRTKTRTTSPFSKSLTIDRQTSPLIQVTQEEELRIEIENEVEDLGISINLSSPRFSLRLPQNPREVLSNLEDHSPSKIDRKEINQDSKVSRKYTSSSSSVDADNSSEISSLGEVRMKLKRRLRKYKISSVSESSTSSVPSRYSSGLVSAEILPLKSEGEVSLGQVVKKPSRRKRKESDGEMAF